MPKLFLSYAGAAHAEHTILVTSFRTGGFFTLSLACNMQMPAALALKMNLIRCRNTPPGANLLFGIYLNDITRETFGCAICEEYLAGQRIDDDVKIRCHILLPDFIRVVHTVAVQVVVTAGRGIITGIILFLPLPGLNGDRSQNSFAGSRNLTGACNSQMQQVFACKIGGIGYFKAGQRLDMIGQPEVDIVQIEGQGDFIDLFNIFSNDIDPILRTGKYQICIRLGSYSDSCILTGLNIDLADDRRIVAGLIANCKLDSMDTLGQLNTVNGKNLAIKVALDLNTVDISTGAGSIQTGRIHAICFVNLYTKTKLVVCSNGCLFTLIIQVFLLAGDRLNIGNLTKDRGLAVITSAGVVDGQIINIESIDALNTGSCGPVIFTAAAAVQLAGQLMRKPLYRLLLFTSENAGARYNVMASYSLTSTEQ